MEEGGSFFSIEFHVLPRTYSPTATQATLSSKIYELFQQIFTLFRASLSHTEKKNNFCYTAKQLKMIFSHNPSKSACVAFRSYLTKLLSPSKQQQQHRQASSSVPLKIMCFSYPQLRLEPRWWVRKRGKRPRAQRYMEWIKWKINNTRICSWLSSCKNRRTTTTTANWRWDDERAWSSKRISWFWFLSLPPRLP